MKRYKIAWLFWIVGLILVGLEWLGVLPPKTDLVGYVIGFFGIALLFFQKKESGAGGEEEKGK